MADGLIITAPGLDARTVDQDGFATQHQGFCGNHGHFDLRLSSLEWNKCRRPKKSPTTRCASREKVRGFFEKKDDSRSSAVRDLPGATTTPPGYHYATFFASWRSGRQNISYCNTSVYDDDHPPVRQILTVAHWSPSGAFRKPRGRSSLRKVRGFLGSLSPESRLPCPIASWLGIPQRFSNRARIAFAISTFSESLSSPMNFFSTATAEAPLGPSNSRYFSTSL